jgi:hypothetical protein
MDLSKSKSTGSLLNVKDGSFISRGIDGSLDLSVKGRSRSSHTETSWDDVGGGVGAADYSKSRRSSCVSSTTMLSEKDSHSTDSSFESQFSPEPLNMSLKKSPESGNFYT